MHEDAITTFAERMRRSFGPLTSELAALVRTELEALARAPSEAPWLRALHEASEPARELLRDPTHGFVLLAHAEQTHLYRPPHDHGRSWVVYALQRGEMEICTYARIVEPSGRVRLVRRETQTLRPGDARVYLPGDIHDTRCVQGPCLLFRFTERDLKREDQEAHMMTRYVERNGAFTVETP